MSRRDVLTAAELALATSALSATVYGLVRAAYDPYAAVQWVPVAIVGAVTALAFVGLAALLVVGRTALLLAPDAAEAVRVWRRLRTAPPSATHRPRPGTGSRRAAPGDGHHARAMAEVNASHLLSRPRTTVYGASQAAQPPRDGRTVPMPVVTVASAGWQFGGGR